MSVKVEKSRFFLRSTGQIYGMPETWTEFRAKIWDSPQGLGKELNLFWTFGSSSRSSVVEKKVKKRVSANEN